MALSRAQIAYVHDVAVRVAAAPRGERSALVAEAARHMGCSAQTMYKRMADVAGVESGRKKRADAGERRVDRNLALLVGGYVQAARRKNGKKTMSVKRAVEILEKNGHGVADPETGEITMPSPQTISRAMREYGCHPDQLAQGTPAVRMSSPHPNWCWQVDASVCVLYYLPGGKLALLDERTYNARKPGRLADIGNLRIVRYVVVDHCSGALYLRYAQERGESAAGVLLTLIEAMSDRGDRDPMRGAPFTIYADPGSGNRASLLREFADRLDIRLIHHAPGAARATGSVEVHQNIVEREFESRLRFQSVADLKGLQAAADRWRCHFNAHAVHTRLKCSRNAAWQRIAPDQLRTASREALMAVARWGEQTRRVSGAFTISVDTRMPAWGVQEYDLRALGYSGLNVRDTVRVELNPFKAPAVTVIKDMPDGQEMRWEVSPIVKNEYGFDVNAPVVGREYKSLPDTRTDKAVKDVAARASASSAPGAAPARPFADIDSMADVRQAPLIMPRKGVNLTLDAPVAEAVPLTRVQAAQRLRLMAPDAWERNAVGCMDVLRATYPDVVPEADLPALAETLGRRFGTVRPGVVVPFTLPATGRQASMGGAS